MLILVSMISLNSFFSFMSIEYVNAILVLITVLAFVVLGMSFADGFIDTLEAGLVTGVGLTLSLLYNLDIVPGDDLLKGVFFVVGMVFSLGGAYMLYKKLRE